MTTSSLDVLIAGAGPAGSAAATWLARAGHRVVVADRASFPREKACSEYLSPAAVRLLERLGVAGDLRALGAVPLRGTRVLGPRGASLTGSFTQVPGTPAGREGLAVARRVLDHRLMLEARAAGAEVREQTAVTELLYEDGAVAGAVLRASDGRHVALRARVVIGADGLRSVVARRMGRRRYGHPARLAFVAHVAGVPDLDGHAEMHVGEMGYVGLNRIQADRADRADRMGVVPVLSPSVANVALVVPARLATEARGRVPEFFFEQLRRFPGVAGRVDPGGVVREILVTGPFAAWSGRVHTAGALLVGDAADFFDPFTGEGIYSALRGAELAADVLHEALGHAPGVVPRAALERYRIERRAAFAGKWAVERLVGYGMFIPALFDRAVRRLEHHGLGHTFVGVTADMLPARSVLNPWFLSRMVV